jgi:dTDP-4-dehydrorhamnose 3,5-epimerase
MKLIETGIPGLVVVEPRVHGDSRGFFMEAWHAGRYEANGMPGHFVQSNVSRSAAGVMRGLHYQHPQAQGKLISVLEGRVFDVAVDIRSDSPTFRQWAGVELSAENHRQLYVPEGFAHGFCVLGDTALLSYLCTTPFNAVQEASVVWNDPDIGIEWPLEPSSVSIKDRDAPKLSDINIKDLPRMTA